jgi:hypothetical protein
MENLKMYCFLGTYNIVLLAPLAGLLCFAANRSYRVSRSRTWPRAIALGFGLVFLIVALVPFAKFGAEWGLFWFSLTLPFSVLLEFNGAFGFTVSVIVATIASASFWSTFLYVIGALIVRVKRRA